MTQPIISQQELIEVVPFEGSLLFGKIPVSWREHLIPVIAGISQEVYRNQTYLGSVNSASSQIVHVRRGDVIYRVSLAPQFASFKGTIVTTDGYRRTYDVNLDLVVHDAKRCVEHYRNGVDLINSAIYILRKGVVQYLQQYTHDEIGTKGLNIVSYNTLLNNEYGFVFKNLNWETQADPRRTSEIDAQQKAEQWKREIEADVAARIHEFKKQAEWRKVELYINAGVKTLEQQIKRDQERIQKRYEQDEKAWQNDQSRQEKMKSKLNESRIRLLEKAVDELIKINNERMLDAIDSNASARGVLEDSLRLIGVFEQLGSEDMVNSPLSVPDNTIILEADSEEPETEEIETDKPKA